MITDAHVDHRAANRLTWQSLQNRGMQPGESLDCYALFASADQEHAVGLIEALRHEGFASVETEPRRVGFLRRRSEWEVDGVIRLHSASLEAMDALVDRMLQQAARHGAIFQGLTAEPFDSTDVDEDWD